MKSKLKFALVVLLAGFVTLGTQSCNKYEEGPAISLKSRTERVANNWKVENYKKNDNDYTSLYTSYKETYTKEGNYSYDWGTFAGKGTWAFQNNDQEIKITGTENQSDQTLFILKLEEKEFWYYYMDGNDKKEFHLIQQ